MFYVYEHWRPDLDQCFYVGKGKGGRANEMGRNNHHKGIQKKLKNLGMGVEVRFYKTGLTEEEAFSIEMERIDFWKSAGIKLANKSNGGEGPTGARWKQSPEHRAKISVALKGKKKSVEHRAKLSIAFKGNKRCLGRKLSEASMEKMKISMKITFSSQEVRDKISRANKGRKQNLSAEQRAKKSERMKGNKNTLGFKPTVETRLKMSEAHKKHWASPEARKKRSNLSKLLKLNSNFYKNKQKA